MKEFNSPSSSLPQSCDAANIDEIDAAAAGASAPEGRSSPTESLPLRHALRDLVGLIAMIMVWTALVAIVVR